MSHQRLAANAIAAGEPIENAPYIDRYNCDGCGKVLTYQQIYARVQGQVFRLGAAAGYLGADLCGDCWAKAPVSTLVRGGE